MSIGARALILALAAAAAAPGASGAEFQQDFRKGPPDPKHLRVVGAEGGCKVEPTAEGLRVTIPAGANRGGVGVELTPWLKGNFEVVAAYEVRQIGPPKGGYGAGVGLSVEADAPVDPALTVERQVDPKDGPRFVSTHMFNNDAGERQYRPELSKAAAATGRLRVARTGSSVETSFAEGDGTFRALRKVDLGAGAVHAVRLTCFTGNSDCAVDVVLTDLSVRADELAVPGVRAPRPVSQGGLWKRLMVAAVINALLVAGFAVWRWPGLLSRGLKGAAGGTTLVAGCLLVGAVSMSAHLRAVGTNSVHEDERIWTERAYFYRLAVFHHDFDHPLWGDFDGIDAPHLGEFLTGFGLHTAGLPVPEVPARTMPWGGAPLPEGARLRAARLPSAVLGALVAPMVYAVTVLATRWPAAGLAAGLLYAFHPLALLCESRAMSESGYMFFSVLAVLATAWACRRDGGGARQSLFGPRGLMLLAVGPASVGLATAGKLTGVFGAAMVVGTVAALVAWGLRGPAEGRRAWVRDGAVYAAIFAALSGSWTVLFNPTLYPDPVGRFRAMSDHRLATGQGQAAQFPHWALRTPADKVRAAYRNVATVQGYGNAGAALTVLSAAGLAAAAAGELRRFRRGAAPSPALAVLVWAAVLALGMLPALPLDWERYFLPFVPPWAVGVGAALGTALDAVVRWDTGRAARRAEAKVAAPTAVAAAR